ncbi:hypothetical protein DICSQDRAFT_57708 [Dichomitus squalens LYAD-421 SS1]|uniref:uncharacterized protein n=1 Tax=Dichomitus squalens (strain LYAD-421) TaxID=732165 RepID=UPI0004411C50|nr:uncharacterized protein DICSQDRAFT_57708 [Dichomitus squalens LYAD-421 SS1]EJF62646.1 hypothetical protein DICSQDRAFT_57708 [Dichomitus squalens LYAD-421 SS1]
MASVPAAPSVPLTPAERALRDSLLPQEFRDVHLYAFTRKTIFSDGSSRIDHPLPIFAVGSILKDTDHFSKLLTSGFAEASTDGQNPIRQYAHESEYDYDSDSDLDEFEEVEDVRTPVASLSSKGKVKEENVNEPESPMRMEGGRNEKSHRVFIPNIAHRTLKACIFYLYTDKINFLPLRSKGSAQRRLAFLTTAGTLAPPCSPKSMYRLAEAYGISKLQDLAYDAIVSQLGPQNIVTEAFSSFFARYDRLREHAVSYLSQVYSDPAVQEALPDFVDRIALGCLPHASGVLRSLLGLRVTLAPPSRTTQPIRNIQSEQGVHG